MLDLDSNNRFVQFELWHDCTNNCAFCHNIGSGDINKLKAIDFVTKKMNDKTLMRMFNEIGFIGGEFFDRQLDDTVVHCSFYDILLNKVHEFIHSGAMKKFYITSAMMFNDIKYLDEFCRWIKAVGLEQKTLLCTSYDTIGRFDNGGKLQNWMNNMVFIRDNFDVKTHTEIILTGDFMNKVLDNEFDIIEFQNKFKTTIDFISPHIIDHTHSNKFLRSKILYNDMIPDFFPSRSTFFKFVKKTIIDEKSIQAFKFLSNFIRADLVYTIKDGNYYEISGRRNGDGVFNGVDKKMGITYIDGYIDSDIRMEDDAEVIRSTVDNN